MVPDAIQVPTIAPTHTRIRIAGIPFAILVQISSIISSQVMPTRNAINAAIAATMIRSGSVL